MVHRKKGRKLKRTASHRSALLANLSIALIINKRIKTTEAKAKELRRFIEPLVSKARKALKYKDSAPEKNVHLRREARKFLNNKEALIILFDEIGLKVGDRPGGYTRVLKTGTRYGDGARTAIIEFVDYNYVKAREESDKEKEAKRNPDTKKTEAKETKDKETKGTKVKKADAKATDEKKKEVKKKAVKKTETKKAEESSPKTKKTSKKKTEDN
ncbi:MAG: 50S ribosomal protein L17 [Ignavibacteria bacterium]|nr:50S ribosomal protein L17 [Ignavibacteria bacterium]